jgi:hypothetical protein
MMGISLVLVSGCASSKPAAFYHLEPLGNLTTDMQKGSREGSIIVAIGPVMIPDYIDRAQIVTRASNNELKLAEFNRWAGSLEDDTTRVLVENISALLPQDRFFVMRWISFEQLDTPSAYSVRVNIIRFEGAPGNSVLLKAQWLIFDKKNTLLLKKEAHISESVNGNGYDALVESMSRALGNLSQDIAGGIKSASSKTAQK